MQTEYAPGQATDAAPEVDKLYMENTLLRVAGALFCHDAQRAAQHTDEIALNRGIAEKAIVVRPDPRLGQPGPLAHKLFVALMKKHSDQGRSPCGEVSFTKRELMRLIGRKGWGGRNSEQLARALFEIHHAFVRTGFKHDDGRYIEHSFNIFPEIYLERAERETDPIETCVVTLARPIVESLRDSHFTCLNHALMRELGTVGQALYMRLFFHFANLFDGHHRKRLTFQKQYRDVCTEWLGGLKVLSFRSTIEREQLGPHLRQLVNAGFLASYTINKAASNDGGFVIIFRPGTRFFDDYDRFYRYREQGSVRVEFEDDHQQVAEPLKLVYRFIEKRTGQASQAVPYVSSREVETAKQLLEQVPFEEAPRFLDYALREAEKTDFAVQSLGGLRQYLPAYLAAKEKRAASDAAAARRREAEQEAAERHAYERFVRDTADRIFASLPADEQATIIKLAQSANAGFGRSGPLADAIAATARARITVERHPDHIPAYEAWRGRRAA